MGVLVGTVFVFSGVELSPQQIDSLKAAGRFDPYLQAETMRVVTPYLVLGAIVFAWALLILRTRFPRIAEEVESEGSRQRSHLRNLFRHPHFVQGVVAQFFYVGAQVGTWSYYIAYIQDYTREPEKIAGYFLTGTLVAFGVGRFTATYLMKFVQPSRLMGIYGCINMALAGVAILFPGWPGVFAVFLTSFFMSLMFPTIFALGIKELGPNTKLGGSVIIMAIIGGAVFTPIMGLVFQISHSMATALLVPQVCYAFITYYSFLGSKVRLPEVLDLVAQ
jgi:FHS family L-fucose permease-like MFS transporter